jgi:hypothetical protein
MGEQLGTSASRIVVTPRVGSLGVCRTDVVRALTSRVVWTNLSKPTGYVMHQEV